MTARCTSAAICLGVELFIARLHHAGDVHLASRSELVPSVGIQALQVPLLVDRVRRHEARDDVGDHVLADAGDVLLTRLGVQQLVALLVDHLALVVVDVVEVEQVLADVEVVRFDLALRVGDLAC
jgi:hypothetical protein